jgi:hypothetical protein
MSPCGKVPELSVRYSAVRRSVPYTLLGDDVHEPPPRPVNSPPSLIARLVSLCIQRAWIVVLLSTAFFAVMTHYAVNHFAMTTDTYTLLSPKLAWRARETAFNVAALYISGIPT